MNFYSNGKLLITGEYVVLDGAKSLAIPTKFGQSLVVDHTVASSRQRLTWESLDEHKNCWYSFSFFLDELFGDRNYEDDTSRTLSKLLREAKRLNPDFLAGKDDFHIKTMLTFPQNWGLGSSSTLIHNIALWANVDPYTLLWNAFSGSGYDIACAKHHTPIVYEVHDKTPKVTEVDFSPVFAEQLYFVHLNQKQNSRNAITRYQEKKGTITNEIKIINAITTELISCTSLIDFNLLLDEHEQIIAGIIDETPVKERLFPDYFGQLKSLGAWGGDFILATGNKDTPNYFTKKGYATVVPFEEMIFSKKI